MHNNKYSINHYRSSKTFKTILKQQSQLRNNFNESSKLINDVWKHIMTTVCSHERISNGLIIQIDMLTAI